MKSLGRTNNGGYIVEMNEEEFSAFYRLHTTLIGNPDYFGMHTGVVDGVDLSKVLSALHDLFRSRASIQQLKESVDALDSLLGTVIEKKEND